MAKTKVAVPKKTAAKRPTKATVKKATPKKKVTAKKATARKAPKKEGAKAVAPIYGEHPEGMFARFAALRHEMDHLFASLSRSFGFPELRMPTIELPTRPGITDVRFEVSESVKAVEIRAEVPGLEPDDIEITLAEGLLTVKGQKRDTREEKGKDYYVSERRYGSFQRSFRVPDSVDEDKISAEFEKGVLNVTLPKQARRARRAKSIKAARA